MYEGSKKSANKYENLHCSINNNREGGPRGHPDRFNQQSKCCEPTGEWGLNGIYRLKLENLNSWTSLMNKPVSTFLFNFIVRLSKDRSRYLWRGKEWILLMRQNLKNIYLYSPFFIGLVFPLLNEMQKPHTHKLVNKQFYVQFDYKQFYVPLDSYPYRVQFV